MDSKSCQGNTTIRETNKQDIMTNRKQRRAASSKKKGRSQIHHRTMGQRLEAAAKDK